MVGFRTLVRTGKERTMMGRVKQASGIGSQALRKIAFASAVLVGLSPIAATAQSFDLLYTFSGYPAGANPIGGLVQGADGMLYGTTSAGGLMGESEGTVFKATLLGGVTTLHKFGTQNGDGYKPAGPLIEASNGEFYGTTEGGNGSIFVITHGGKLTTLHTFCSEPSCMDGANPYDGLLAATDGNFYGTTSAQGANGAGTVFKMTPGGTLTTIHAFCSQSGCTDGSYPYAGLIEGTDGNLYGATSQGGAYGEGTIFRILPGGELHNLHSFQGADGANPLGALLQASDGNYYGTTNGGGENGYGTIFKMTPGGTLTTLYSFCTQTNCADGEYPEYSSLFEGTDGNLWGTTYGSEGATVNYGTVFNITTTGTLTTVWTFCTQRSCTDGANPFSGVIQFTNGSFCGVTSDMGANGLGTLYALDFFFGPFVEAAPNLGKVGATIHILGPNFTGTTSVAFNAVPATFTVTGTFEITTTVPSGATTGSIQVVTPRGTLTSNVPFNVLP